ncbi:MAG TPA: hypothetical protein VJM32_01350 [Candidatus Saccharimonadales bacterium]|nr:hypothetical protein [Candidatus Saccharimonadales bacterium]
MKKLDIRLLALYMIGAIIVSVIVQFVLDGLQLTPGWELRNLLVGSGIGIMLYVWDFMKAQKKSELPEDKS